MLAPAHTHTRTHSLAHSLTSHRITSHPSVAQVVPNKWMHFAKLVGFMFVGFLLGSLPYVDNFAQLGGYLFGLVSSIVFLPYVSFGVWHARARLILVAVCIPLLFVMILVSIVMFYTVQLTDCTWCANFNCWEWTDEMPCDGVSGGVKW